MPDANDQGEPLALRVGTLVSVRHRSGAPAAALVVASDSAELTLHVSGRLPPADSEHVVLAFGSGGKMYERETRVLAVMDTSQELRVAAFGSPLPEQERRAVERFDAVGAAELTIGRTCTTVGSPISRCSGRVSTSPCPGPRRSRRAPSSCEMRTGRCFPATRVRVAYRHLPTGARVRIGVEFADARGVADATRRLIDQLNGAR